MKPRAGAHCPQQDRVCCRHDRAQKHHATLPTSKTPAPSSLGLGRWCVGMSGPGPTRTEAGEEAARKPPHWEPLTLPCISSRMVRVTFRPPSETFDSISYQGMGDVR